MSFEIEPEEVKLKNLAELESMQSSYVPSEATREVTKNKIFIPVIAPFRSGKTVITDRVVAIEPRIRLSNSSVTRLRKPDEDQPNFKTASEGYTSSWFLENAKQGAFANFSVIPGVDAYGTLAEDFPGDYSIGPFLPSSLSHLKQAGFKKLPAMFIVTEATLWKGFATQSRKALGEKKFVKRALESIDSVNYALSHLDELIFLENTIQGSEGIDKVAHKIIDIAFKDSGEQGLAKDEAVERLEAIKSVAKEFTLE